MQTSYAQASRPLSLTTPLGADALLLVGLRGREALSQLFQFQLEVLTENRNEIPFDQLLGQPATVTVTLPTGKERYFGGIVSSIAQGGREQTFTRYRLEMVPQFWLLTRRSQSRIFQHLNVPDILKKVLAGLNVSYDIQGVFHPRDYCVQYRESDFAFASRLMEEEGIYYFFKHNSTGHQLVLANMPRSHPDVPEQSRLIYEEQDGGWRSEDRIHAWEKRQELRSGRTTLWDHCFELPHKHLETSKSPPDRISVGQVTHRLKTANANLEQYDFPGGYAGRFDGIDRGGGPQPAELSKIFEDNERTATIRMQQESVPALTISGASNCRQLTSGHKFTLERHFNANGPYVLTSVQHEARWDAEYRTGEGDFEYSNTFTCIPFTVPYRPLRVTPRPVVQGTQTAVVVGPSGEEIFTDKYGRVKVQFHWDREGQRNAESSCWIRVSQIHAGRGWGAISIPRIGEEVIVDFLEGDPDQPIIIGRVYNADHMPPNALPGKKMISGMKSNTYPGGGGFNEIHMDDSKGNERMIINAQYNQDMNVNNNRTKNVGVNETNTIGNDQTEFIANNRSTTVGNNSTEQIGNNATEIIGQNLLINAGTSITLKCGASTLHMNQAGVITISGTLVSLIASINANVAAPITNVAGGFLLTNTGILNVSTGMGLNLVAGAVVNVEGSVVNVDGSPVNINC